ncbi:GHKL domain-containing protein [Solibacillus sp. FSL W7-1464]|uniref:sensor histidine kinase n=1 Tax=Solibacillus sp. FSL W7-1464 TaxID=2921706 RepID=UPI0030F8C72A
MDGLTIEAIILFLIQYLMLLFFNTYVLDLSWSKKQLLTIVLIIFLPTSILFQFIGAISILYYLAIFTWMIYRKNRVVIHIFHSLVALIFLVISDNISSIVTFHLLGRIGNDQLTLFSYISLFILLGILFAFCYKRIANLINRWVFHRVVSYILVFLGFVAVVFMYINIMKIDHGNFNESVQDNLVMFLTYVAILTISITTIVFLAFKQFKMEQREQQINNFESYVASLEQINQDMRKFKHDYINILTSLRIFIDDKNYDGLHTYFYEYILEASHQEQLNQHSMMVLNNLKINSLKGLLTTKILQAQSHQVPFHIEIVEEITDIPVDPIVLNRMVGILLDNAIEAARETEDGEVRAAFIHMKDAILLVVTNKFNESTNIKVHEIYKEGFSTKGENRGLGLANLRQMKNNLKNVSLNTKISPPYFIQEIEFKKG